MTLARATKLPTTLTLAVLLGSCSVLHPRVGPPPEVNDLGALFGTSDFAQWDYGRNKQRWSMKTQDAMATLVYDTDRLQKVTLIIDAENEPALESACRWAARETSRQGRALEWLLASLSADGSNHAETFGRVALHASRSDGACIIVLTRGKPSDVRFPAAHQIEREELESLLARHELERHDPASSAPGREKWTATRPGLSLMVDLTKTPEATMVMVGFEFDDAHRDEAVEALIGLLASEDRQAARDWLEWALTTDLNHTHFLRRAIVSAGRSSPKKRSIGLVATSVDRDPLPEPRPPAP